jgi:ribosomal protein S27AE
MDTKWCKGCDTEKPLLDFYKYSNGNPLHICKECHKASVRANYAEKRAEKSAYERERYKKPARRAKMAEYQRVRRARSPEKYRARTAVGNAIRDGRLVPKPCEDCGSTERVQAHHADYSKPLEVRWLCFKCHREHEHGQVVTETGLARAGAVNDTRQKTGSEE